MPKGFFHGGVYTVRPQVLSKIVDVGLIPFTVGSPRIVAIVGKGEGGPPGVPTILSSGRDAQSLIRAGELLLGTRLCFAPSAENPGPSQIIVVRVNPATQATLTLDDAAATDSIVLTSVNWGVRENQIKVKVEAGTTLGKKITLMYVDDVFVKDDLYQAAMTVQYVGLEATATMTITAASIAFTAGADSVTFLFADYPTLQSLVAAIDTHAKYTAVLNAPNPDFATANALDFVTAVDVKTAPTVVTRSLQYIVEWLNSGQQPLVTAARATGAGAVPNNIAFTYLAGGAEGTAQNTDWQNALDALESYDVGFVVVLSGDAAHHAMADAHCQSMSANGRRPRRAFSGGVLGEHGSSGDTLSTYKARANAINSDRTALAVQGIKTFDLSGVATTLAPYMTAALVAGLQAGVNEIGDSITHRSISATGLEWVPSIGELELGIAASLLMLEQIENRGGYRVARGVSTWRKDDTFNRVEFSTGIALDEVVRDVVEALDPFIGKKASPGILHLIGSRTEAVLAEEQRQGILVGDDADPAYRNIVIQLQNGDEVLVSFECQPVNAINFIGVTVKADIYSGVIQLATIRPVAA